MTIKFLDVTRLHTKPALSGEISLPGIVNLMRISIDDMATQGLLKKNMSFGVAIGTPSMTPDGPWNWWDPYGFTHMVAGWGPERNRYIANAVRKLRPLLRTGKDTLWLRRNDPGAFQDNIDSADSNGRFPWGDFPWGGGVFVDVGGVVIPVAVSALREVEDDAVAKLIGGLYGAEMLKQTEPDEFA